MNDSPLANSENTFQNTFQEASELPGRSERLYTPTFLLLLVCLIFALAWLAVQGGGAGAPAYTAFRSAQAARSPADLAGLPPFTALLAVLGWLGLPIASTAVTLSLAGWLAALGAVYGIAVHFKRLAMAVCATLMLILQPDLPDWIGCGTLCAAGLVWAAAALTLAHPRRAVRLAAWAALAAIALAYGLLALTSGQAMSPVLAWQMLAPLFWPLPALGVGWLVEWGLGLSARLPLARVQQRRLAWGLLAVAWLGWGYMRGPAVWQRWRQADERLAAWFQAGDWLRDHTPVQATVAGDQPDVLAYVSQRSVVDRPESGAAADRPAAWPDYWVSSNTLTGAEQVNLDWFQERYRRAYTVLNPYDSLTPLTVWRYYPSPFDVGRQVDQSAHLAESLDGAPLELLGHRLDSPLLIPGEDVHLTLSWRALGPLTRLLGVTLRLYDPLQARTWLQVHNPRPAGLKTTLWSEGDRLTDRYVLSIPADLPPGDYALDVQVYADEDVAHALPFDQASSQPAWLTLTRMEVQPWISSSPLWAPYTSTAVFGQAIELVGYDSRPWPDLTTQPPLVRVEHDAGDRLSAGDCLSASDRLSAGDCSSASDGLRLRLYWRALATPAGSYHVFVHLLSPQGQLLAQHDGIPAYAAHPTDAWQAGQYILDEHVLSLDAGLPPGRYDLTVGLYLPDSDQRLDVQGQAGRVVEDRSWPLFQVNVP